MRSGRMMKALGRYNPVMANFAQRVSEMLHSPKTQEMINKVKAQATKPENKAKITNFTDKFRNRGGPSPSDRGGPSGPGGPGGPGY
jgi:hypothetical protein